MKSLPPYVPVLRWKGAEAAAVQDLTLSQRRGMRPLFELVPQSLEKLPLDRAVQLRARDISLKWGWDLPCFVDLGQLEDATKLIACQVLDRQDHLAATLVTPLQGVLEPRLLRELARVRRHGLAIRLSIHEFRQAHLVASLLEMARGTGLSPHDIDILIDYGSVATPPERIAEAVATIQRIDAWRSITVLAGAFPPDLSKLKKNEQHLLARHEWIAYCRFVRAGGVAGYGDYTIQHPVYEEHERKGMNFSASIRYTGLTDWVIMRGESVRNDNGPGYAQWPAHAQLLAFHSEFRGADFSAGDNYISAMGAQMEKTGNPKDWISAGINHHLALVVHQLEHIDTMPTESAIQGVAAPDWPAQVAT